MAIENAGIGFNRIASVSGILRNPTDDALGNACFYFLLFIIAVGILGPHVTPYEYDRATYTEDGELMSASPPSVDHPFGTTMSGFDVLSRILYGARATVITGLLGGSIIITLGSTVGIVAGYSGGRTDSVLMRLTDFVYGIPLIPMALVMIALFGMGFFGSILIMGFILWRSSARVLRSQVLQLKERPYVQAAQMMGGNRLYIIRKHVIPNVASMAVLFFALGIGWAILVQAGLAFIGAVTPFVPSWGIMLRNAYSSGLMEIAWWWAVAPGIMISLTVFSAFTFGRKFSSDKDASRGMA